MIRLRTLGALDLRRTDGTELHSVLAQPKRLALLAYLGVAAPRGFHRRDTLLALFWPELDQSHARNALSRAVYYLRRALNDAAIASRGDELGVSEEHVRCDVVAFERALADGRVSEALDAYGGELLPGFHLSGTPQFERWLEDRRAVLRGQAADAAWACAKAAERDGDVSAAERYARRALELSPYDERGLDRLLRLLDRHGGRGQAIAAYEQFARRLAADLGVEPSGHAQTLIDTWRRDASPRTREALTREPAHLENDRRAPSVARRPGFPWTNRRRLAIAVAAVAGAWILEPRKAGLGSATQDATMPRSITIAVLPFTVRAQEPGLAFLREGMVDLISAKLNSAVGLRSLEPGALLATPALRDPKAMGPSEGRAVGARFGADFYVLGNVVAAGDQVQISAGLYPVGGASRPAANATATGAINDLFALVDRVTADLLAEIGTPSERLARVASLTTQSPAALRAYLDAENALRRANFASLVRLAEPIEAFREAVRLDSTFALAYYRLASTAAWADSLTLARWAAARAVRHAGRLPPHYRSLSEGLDAFLRGDGRQAILAHRMAVTTHPEDVETWLRLGISLAIYGPLLRAAPGDAWEPFAVSARLGTRDVMPWVFLSHLAMDRGDLGAIDTLLARGYPDGLPPYWPVVTAIARHDTGETRVALDRLHRAEPWEQTYSALLVTLYLGNTAAGRRIGSRSVAAALGSDWHTEAQFWVAQVEMAAGRLAAAEELLTTLAVRDPRRAAELKAMFASWPVSPRSRSDVETARRMVRRAAGLPLVSHHFGGQPRPDAAETIRLYLLGLLSMRLGERDSALYYARKLDARQASATLGSVSQDLALCLRAEVRGTLDGAPREGLALMRGVRYEVPLDLLKAHQVLGHVFARMRFVQGQWAESLRRTTEALQWYSSLGQMDQMLDLPFLGPAALFAGRTHEEEGDLEEARAAYTRFVTLWHDPEPQLRPLVDSARARLARLNR